MSDTVSTSDTIVTPPTEADDTVIVRTNELILGRQLSFPLHDHNGVLLLAEGSQITPKFKEQLARRRIDRVRISLEDCRRLTISGLSETSTGRDDIESLLERHSDLIAPLDEIVDAGALFVANTGSPVGDHLVMRGTAAYDPGFRERLVAEHRACAEALEFLMADVARGKGRAGGDVAAIADRYIEFLKEDVDCVVSLVTEPGGPADIPQHCTRMAILGMAIGIELGLDARNVHELGICGFVHDWGMMRVPESLRNSDRVLHPIEFLQIKKHSIHTLEMLQHVSDLPAIVPLVCYQVHEQPNGRGYPRGRRGNQIHLYSRVLRVADVFAGMVERRPHRPPFSAYSAMECLVRLSRENAVDPRVVRTMLHLVSMFPIGSHVSLDDGRVARVIRRNDNHWYEPVVTIVRNADGRDVEDCEILDLMGADTIVSGALPTPGTDEVMLEPEQIHVKRE